MARNRTERLNQPLGARLAASEALDVALAALREYAAGIPETIVPVAPAKP